jgi:hypothetical protein
VKNSTLRQSTLALLMLLAVGMSRSLAQPSPAPMHPLAQLSDNDPIGTDPEPPPPCCSLVAVH